MQNLVENLREHIQEKRLSAPPDNNVPYNVDGLDYGEGIIPKHHIDGVEFGEDAIEWD